MKCLRATAMPIAEMQHFAEITRQGELTVKERRELLEAHQSKVALELQEMQQTLALIDAKTAHYRSLERNIQHAHRISQHAATLK